MIMNNNFNVLLLNDLCSYGKASLTVNIPVLSHFGIKVSPLVSVILSNHTAFESFCAFDLTEQLEKIVEELKIRKPNFDAFYVGWIASGKQPSIVVDIIKHFNIGTILIDPILGDNGKLYPSMSDKHVNAMKELIKYANIATPNITELAILLGKDPSLQYNEEEVKDMARELSEMGPKTVIVTSVSKDVFAYALRVHNTMKNNEIPEDKKSFVAKMDATTGFITAIVQISAGLALANKKVQSAMCKKLFSVLDENSKQFKQASAGFAAVSTLVGATVLAKRILVPLISTPIAGYLENKHINDNKKAI